MESLWLWAEASSLNRHSYRWNLLLLGCQGTPQEAACDWRACGFRDKPRGGLAQGWKLEYSSAVRNESPYQRSTSQVVPQKGGRFASVFMYVCCVRDVDESVFACCILYICIFMSVRVRVCVYVCELVCSGLQLLLRLKGMLAILLQNITHSCKNILHL